MGYKKDYKEIVKYVKCLKRKYKFKGLLHFTDFSNLKTILDEGYLYSRNHCENNNISFVDGANHSVLDKASECVQDCVRFYYRGKTPTLYENEGIKLKEYCDEIHIPIPVYLLFDEKLLYLDNTEFSNGNATNSEIGNTASFFETMDWNAIFHNTWFEPDERDYIINKRQAELLSYDSVPLTYLNKIIFRCEADRKRAINIFGNDNRYKVDINLFSDKNSKNPKNECEKNNFIKDYKIQFEYDSSGKRTALIVDVSYQKKWKDYETKFNIVDINGKSIKEYKKSITYRSIFGEILENSINNNETKVLRLEGEIQKWFKLEIYVNNILCIEEFLIKYDISSYNITFSCESNKTRMILNREFVNNNFLNYNHKYEIFNSDEKLIYEGSTSFKEGSTGLSWNLTLNNYDDNWFKIKYYMNNVLCISEEIKKSPF